MYTTHYNEHISKEKKNIAVFEIMKYQIIDTTKRREILSQIYLLDNLDKIATYIALSSNKVVNIYTYDGIQTYSTDRNSNRKVYTWNKMEIKQFEKNKEMFNQNFNEVFISVFKYSISKNEIMTFYVEHNEKLSDADIKSISRLSAKEK